MQDAAQIHEALSELSALLSYLRQPKFKIMAYERAAETVATLGPELATFVEQDRLRELPGIGSAISAQIQELYNTGSSQLLERLRSDAPAGAAELVRVPGLTPRRIQALSDALGVRSLDELLTACREGRVRSVRGFGAKTEQQLLEAGERWLQRSLSQPPAPLLLSRALEVAEQLLSPLARAGLRASIAGALRRGEETPPSLELVVASRLEEALDPLRSARGVLRIDAAEQVVYLAERRTAKVFFTPPERWGNALFTATGDEAHVAAVTARAHARGVTLSAQAFETEHELYGAAELPFVPPELRGGLLSLEASAAQAGDLVDIASIQGMVHCHTTFSDGKHSVLEMAQAAHALGMRYITITDHSPSAHYAGGVSVDTLYRQWEEIAAAQEQVPVRILRGVESDILRDGSLDYPDEVLSQLDVVIASIHARHRLNREEMTARLRRALSLPLFKIWGHGLGRILNHREPIDCDVTAVLDALAESRGAIELNADPHRLDLPPRWIPEAVARGIPFVVSVDAHSVHGFDVLRYGVTMARRGGLRRSQVLNTLTADEFIARVRPFPELRSVT
ncbi:MAG: PHP domain-containing protein [Myxococcales bacterium]|nr:MAG: PHP domain-containing protein [Myxococcales bacterium]